MVIDFPLGPDRLTVTFTVVAACVSVLVALPIDTVGAASSSVMVPVPDAVVFRPLTIFDTSSVYVSSSSSLSSPLAVTTTDFDV